MIDSKRLTDIFITLLSLPILLPITICLALAVLLIDGRPVFFWQVRAGIQGQQFQLIKFRTMIPGKSDRVDTATDGDRITKLGAFLRRTSLDELPEFWNILKGDMSLVGPRPLLPEYLPLYNQHQARRHEVRPGLTGLAQVRGRNALSWEERFDLDVWYVDNRSGLLDLRILIATIGSVVRPRGISAENSATMPKFTGSKCDD